MTGYSQVVISEVYADGTFQVTNTGTETVDVSSYWICSFPTYEALSMLEIACGSTTIAPASSTTFSGFSYSESDIAGSELALYNTNAFSDPTAILSYIEWGAWGHARSAVATEAGIWQAERFAPDLLANQSLTLADNQWTVNNNPVICPMEDNSTDEEVAMTMETYTITLNTIWSEELHPTDFPSNPHFSGLVGMTHTSDAALFELGTSASTGIKNMAETGAKIFLIQEIQQMVMQGSGGSLISGNGINLSPGSVSIELIASSNHSLMSFVSMIAPSPDWFIGIKDFELYKDGKWVDRATIPVNVYDAGTDSGDTYTSPNLATEPQGLIEMITGGPLATNGVIPSLGSITIERMGICELATRSISTPDTTIFCVGEGIDNLVNVDVTLVQDDARYLESAWVVTNPLGIITDLPDGPPFNFEASEPGISNIWNVNYAEGLQGLEINNQVAALEGCFALSNPIEVILLNGDACSSPIDTMESCDLSPSSITTTHTTIFCVGEGIDDLIDVELNLLQDDATYLESAWVITNSVGVIIDLPEGPPFNFEDAEPGICRIWNLNYAEGLQGLVIDNPVEELEGCFVFSNSIEVFRLSSDACSPIDTIDTPNPIDTMETCDLSPRSISTIDTTIFCVGEGLENIINVEVNLLQDDASYLESAWVITNSIGTILDLPEEPTFNFEDVEPGICRIWNLNYAAGIEGLVIGNPVEELAGCFTFSNPIEVIRLPSDACNPSSDTIDTSNPIDTMNTCDLSPRLIDTRDTTIFCVGDNVEDLINVDVNLLQDDASYLESAWVITNTLGIILDLPEGPPFNFEDAGSGVCRIWNLNYAEGIEGLAVNNRIEALEGCFTFSNPIEVIRLSGDACMAPVDPVDPVDDSDPIDTVDDSGPIDTVDTMTNCALSPRLISTPDTTIFCVGEGIDDFVNIDITLLPDDTTYLETAWVITNTAGIILELPLGPPFSFEEAEPGICRIWNLNYAEGLQGLTVDNSIENLAGCFTFSNSIEVFRLDSEACAPPPVDTCNLLPRLISTPDTTIFCVGEGIDNLVNVDVNLLQNNNVNYKETAWVITNTAGVILDLPAGPPFSFEDAEPGICRIWNLNYTVGLEGLTIDNNIERLEGCFNFSNPIEVFRLNSDACPSPPVDTMDNSNPVDTMDNSNPVDTMDNSNPVDTMDNSNPVDTMDNSNPVDTMDNSNPVDTMDNSNPMDTMDNSNPVDTMTTMCDVAGGSITGGPFEFCSGDGIQDKLSVDAISLSGNLGTQSQWVITDVEGITILGLPANPSEVDFDVAGVGSCLIWHLSYQDNLSGLEVNSLVADIQGCFSLSNAITVVRTPADSCMMDTTETTTDSMTCNISGGTIEGGPFKFCLEDTIVDKIPVGSILLNDNTGSNSQWIITDSAGIKILGLPNLPSDVDFGTPGVGVCQLWHLSYEDSLVGAIVDGNVADLQGCFSLSNAITVTRRVCNDDENDMVDEEENDNEEMEEEEEETKEDETEEEETEEETGEENQGTCTAPTDPTVTLDGSKKAIINWTAIEGATTYIIQIRFKGQTRWAARATLRKPTVRIFAPAGKDYEYHIKSICDGEESEYGETFEFTTPPSGIIAAESRSSKNDFQADIVLTLPNKQLVLTPNPVSNQLQIDYPSTIENTTMIIYSISGQKVYEQSLKFGTFGQTINVGHLDNGFYILRILENGATAVSHKLIKQ